MSMLTIDIPEELLSQVDKYRSAHQKPSRTEAIKELLNYAFNLPPYFNDWDWDKAEAEADEDIKAGRLTGPFDNPDDLINSLDS